jgi:site-specific recombinase XerD
MTKADIHNQDRRLEVALKKKLPEFNGDRKTVEEFLDKLLVEEQLSPARILKYISTINVLRRMLERDFKGADEKDIKELVTKIEKCDKSGWTKHSYRVVLKRFLRYLGKEPDWLKGGNGKSKEVLPDEILTEEEIKAIAGTAYTTRDRSFVLNIYESGCRIGEFLPSIFPSLVTGLAVPHKFGYF